MNCRSDPLNTWMRNINWGQIDTKLMIRQDPATRAARKRFFSEMDNSGGGSLDARELKEGVLKLLVDDHGQCLVPMGDELMPAVTCAFNASRHMEKSRKGYKVSKGKKAKVGLTEFRPFLVAFKHYLQLLELFEFLDGQGEDNQRLSLRECKRGTLLFTEWGITEEELEAKFKGVDAWVSHLTFKDFATWCIEESGYLANLELDESDHEDVFRAKTTHEMQKEHGIELKRDGHGVRARDNEENNDTCSQLFHLWDTDGTGSISEEELTVVLRSLNPAFTVEQMSQLFAKADHNQDGSLDYDELLKWLLS